MPATGYDPYGGFDSGAPLDMSGNGADPSYAWALAPGGRFPGDEWAWQEYQRALEAGTAGGDPNYDPSRLTEWLAGRRSLLGMLTRGHIANQAGGPGQEPSLPGGYGYHFFSGPGAPYGPASGPTRGLVDQGRPPGQEWDMPEWRPPSAQETGTGKKKGGGKGGRSNFTFTPTAGIQQQSRFVDWQPIAPGTQSAEATRFVPGLGSSTPARPQQVVVPGGKNPKPGRGGGGGGQGGGGGGRGRGGRGGPGAQRPGQQIRGGGGGPGAGGPGDPPLLRPPGGLSVGGDIRDNIYGGVDVGNLDFRTPGWRSDPSTGIFNTGGFPNATPPARMPLETASDYAERLHDLGFNQDDIMSMTGPWSGWGTGGVDTFRDSLGNPMFYGFANQPVNSYNTGAGTDLGSWNPDLWWRGAYGSGDRQAPSSNLATSGGAGGGGTRGAGDLASAAGWYHGLYY